MPKASKQQICECSVKFAEKLEIEEVQIIAFPDSSVRKFKNLTEK